MPVHKKKNALLDDKGATPTVVSPQHLNPENFHQYLRAEIRDATRTVMEEIMREELSQFLGAAWGESTAHRKGYRNGFYTRDLITTAGPIEDLTVPRDRAGEFHTQAFEQYSHYEPQVAEGVVTLGRRFICSSSGLRLCVAHAEDVAYLGVWPSRLDRAKRLALRQIHDMGCPNILGKAHAPRRMDTEIIPERREDERFIEGGPLGDAVADRVKWIYDPVIDRIVATWPSNFAPKLGPELGMKADSDFESIVRAYMMDDMPKA